MAKIIATDRDGKQHELDAFEGYSVMEVLRDAGLPVEALCGGQCVCTTCHVHVEARWMDKLDAANETEKSLLEDSADQRPNSRLSCQIKMHDGLDGLQLQLAGAL